MLLVFSTSVLHGGLCVRAGTSVKSEWNGMNGLEILGPGEQMDYLDGVYGIVELCLI